MKEIAFALTAGMVALFLQTTSLGFFFAAEHKPDLMLILVVWAGLTMNLPTGLAFAFIAGILADSLSGSPTGLFALIYCIVFVCCNYVNANFDMDALSGRFIVVFVASVFGAGVVLLLRWPMGPIGFGPVAAGWIAVKSFVTGLTSILLIPSMDRLWEGYSRLVGLR
ncbi:MAG: rod shape-determining protein MreD [Desulfomonile sp.]|nr:rod shape-determining protein MreD [Deltaproteobacteria bacterium]